MLHRTTHIALGTALVAAAAMFAPAAHADRVGFNVSIAGPGYGVAFGNGPYWRGHHHYRPHYRPVYVPPPVVYAPAVVYRRPRRLSRAARRLPRTLRGKAAGRRAESGLLRVLIPRQAARLPGEVLQPGKRQAAAHVALRGIPEGHRPGELPTSLGGEPQQANAPVVARIHATRPAGAACWTVRDSSLSVWVP